jgi:predicted HAD superfamily Cof-like phosphohydrolase
MSNLSAPLHAGEGRYPRQESASNFQLVKQFHAKFDPDPAIYADMLGLRMNLIDEEIAEVREAMDEVKNAEPENAPEILRAAKAHLVKELCDVLYLTYGTLELLRVDADAAFAEVHRSNMSKTPVPGKKAQKLEGYQPAQMEQFV